MLLFRLVKQLLLLAVSTVALLLLGLFHLTAYKSMRSDSYKALASSKHLGFVYPQNTTNEFATQRYFAHILYHHNPLQSFNISYEEVEVPHLKEPHLMLRGWLMRNSNSTTNTVAILLHGAFGDRRSVSRHVPYFFKSNFHVLTMDFSDHGLSDSSLHRGCTLGVREHFDIYSAIQFVRNEFGSSTRIVLFGSSNGASSSILAMGMIPYHLKTNQLPSKMNFSVDAIIAENPFSSRKKQLVDAYSIVFQQSKGWANEGVSKVPLVGPYLDLMTKQGLVPNWLIQSMALFTNYMMGGLTLPEPEEVVANVNCPLYIIHGTRDALVYFSHGETLFALAKEPKQFWKIDSIEGSAHSNLYNHLKEEFEQNILTFLKQYNLN